MQQMILLLVMQVLLQGLMVRVHHGANLREFEGKIYLYRCIATFSVRILSVRAIRINLGLYPAACCGAEFLSGLAAPGTGFLLINTLDACA